MHFHTRVSTHDMDYAIYVYVWAFLSCKCGLELPLLQHRKRVIDRMHASTMNATARDCDCIFGRDVCLCVNLSNQDKLPGGIALYIPLRRWSQLVCARARLSESGAG